MKARKIIRKQSPRNGIQFVVSPETREELKPIVFFDAGKFTSNENGFKIGFHPHSGIGIVTYFHNTDLHHKDSGHNDGIIYDGGAQWINAGGGVWHEEAYHKKADVKSASWTGSIHQLWLQLPPEWEESEVNYDNLSREEIPVMENVKVLAGEYKGVKGKMNIPLNLTYLDVSLNKGETWEYETPTGQTTGFIFTRDGGLFLHDEHLENSAMGILEHHDGLLKVEARDEVANFIVIIAEPSAYPIVSSGSQIHTNRDALDRSTERIRNIGRQILQ